MRKDIQTEADIRRVVDAFYEGITTDDVIGPYFQKIDLAAHLPKMYAFWSSVVLYSGAYHGNPFLKHLALQELGPSHFERWLQRFYATANALFEGENAERIKMRAGQIGYIFQMKMGHLDVGP